MYVYELNPDIIFITEAWTNNTILVGELTLQGCTSYRRDRQTDQMGGCVLIYITNTLTHFNSNINPNGTESLWCSLVINHGETIRLATCYNSTSNNKEDSENFYNLMHTV